MRGGVIAASSVSCRAGLAHARSFGNTNGAHSWAPSHGSGSASEATSGRPPRTSNRQSRPGRYNRCGTRPAEVSAFPVACLSPNVGASTAMTQTCVPRADAAVPSRHCTLPGSGRRHQQRSPASTSCSPFPLRFGHPLPEQASCPCPRARRKGPSFSSRGVVFRDALRPARIGRGLPVRFVALGTRIAAYDGVTQSGRQSMQVARLESG
jgi:hypothetical protein